MKKPTILRHPRVTPIPKNEEQSAPPPSLEVDAGVEDEFVLTAAKQLTLRCGESSITLTAAGKIILRGKYIVSRSSGVQRIKGGSVQIN
jgi:hypothetical protein